MYKEQKVLSPNLETNPWREGGILRPTAWSENPFKGRDGGSYYSAEALREADQEWKRVNLTFIGRDGRNFTCTGLDLI